MRVDPDPLFATAEGDPVLRRGFEVVSDGHAVASLTDEHQQ
jgi:hypothetical protein